jgi:hypothetical protein
VNVSQLRMRSEKVDDDDDDDNNNNNNNMSTYIHSFIPKLINPLLQNVVECRAKLHITMTTTLPKITNTNNIIFLDVSVPHGPLPIYVCGE